jgi:Flp pilus assembly secretin CpaC
LIAAVARDFAIHCDFSQCQLIISSFLTISGLVASVDFAYLELSMNLFRNVLTAMLQQRLAHGVAGHICRSLFLAAWLANSGNAAGPTTSITPIPVQSKQYEIAKQQSIVFKASDDISSIAVADAAVCSVIRDPNDPKRVMIVGEKHGYTHVTFWFMRPDQDPMTFRIRVGLSARQLREVEKFLNGKFPKAKISLNVIPVSGKILLEGSPSSSSQAAEIVQMLVSDEIPQKSLVNRMKILHYICCTQYCSRGH